MGMLQSKSGIVQSAFGLSESEKGGLAFGPELRIWIGELGGSVVDRGERLLQVRTSSDERHGDKVVR